MEESGELMRRLPPVVDESALGRLRELEDEGEPDLLDKLVVAFLKESQALLQGMQEARRTQDFKLIYMQAHTLKSSSASLGGLALAQSCEDCERLASTGDQVGVEAALGEI